MNIAHDMDRTPLAEQQPSFARNLVAFFNTGFGLWMLSSIVLGGITFGYSEFNRSRIASQSEQNERQRLETEIDLRLIACGMLTQELNLSQNEPTEYKLKDIKRFREKARDIAFFPAPSQEQVFQIQYANRNFISLLAEYLPLLPSFEQIKVRTAIVLFSEAARMRIELDIPEMPIDPSAMKAEVYLQQMKILKFQKCMSDAKELWDNRKK